MSIKHWALNWTVQELRRYLEKKRKELEAIYSVSFDEKTKGFITMLDQILSFCYFKSNYEIRYLMGNIQQDRENMMICIKQSKSKLPKAQDEYDKACKEMGDFNAKHIDEPENESFAEKMEIESRISEAYVEVTSLNHDIEECTLTRRRLHNLLGIIARADDFFESVIQEEED